jgi:hypothetical protein
MLPEQMQKNGKKCHTLRTRSKSLLGGTSVCKGVIVAFDTAMAACGIKTPTPFQYTQSISSNFFSKHIQNLAKLEPKKRKKRKKFKF